MRIPFALFLLGLINCGEPELSIRFDIPEDYVADVETVVLRVLVLEGMEDAADLDCRALAFHQPIVESVDLTRLAQITLSKTQDKVSVSSIPRRGRKLLWGEGIDARGLPLVSACREVSALDRDATIRLAAVPNTVLQVDQTILDSSANQGTGFLSSDPPPTTLSATVVDLQGRPLVGAELLWNVASAGAVIAADEPLLTDVSGKVQVPVQEARQASGLPLLAGPVILTVRTEWSLEGPQVLSWMEAPRPFGSPSSPLVGGLRAIGMGAVGPAYSGAVGQGLAILSTMDFEQSGELSILTFDRAAHQWLREATGAPMENARDIVLLPEDDGWVRVVTIVDQKWVEFSPRDGLTSERTLPITGVATQMALWDHCGKSSDAKILATTREGVRGEGDFYLRIFDSSGNLVDDAALAQENDLASRTLVGTGCVSDLATGVHPSAVFRVEDSPLLVVAQLTDGVFRTEWPSYGSGIAFASFRASGLALLMGTRETLGGITLVGLRFFPTVEYGLQLYLEREDPLIAPAHETSHGDIDGDGEMDLVTILSTKSTSSGETPDQADEQQHRVMFFLGAEHEGRRMTGIWLVSGFVRLRLFLADLDGDQTDEILLVESPPGADGPGPTETGIRVEGYSLSAS